MQERDGIEGVVEVTPASAMVTKDSPILEACNRVLDTRSSLAMSPPFRVPHDAVVAEDRRYQLGHAPISSIGEDSPLGLTDGLKRRAAVMNRVVTVSGSTCNDGDDPQISAADEYLCVA